MATKFTKTLRLPEKVMVLLRELSARDTRAQWVILTEALVVYRAKYPDTREPGIPMKKGRPCKKVTETLTTDVTL